MNITEFPNYTIDEAGNITNTHTRKRLKPSVNVKNGYTYIFLTKDKKVYGRLLHRLLGVQFIPNPSNYTDIDHIDRNRANNDLSNLRWASRSQNLINRSVKNENTRNIEYNRNTFSVRLNRGGKRQYVGSAKTLEEAKTIRDAFLTSIML